MATIKDTFGTITGWAKEIVNLGLALVLVFLVVDLLVPGTTDIVANMADFIASFINEGIIGLIILIAILTIYES